MREVDELMHKGEIIKELEKRRRIIESPLSVQQLLDRHTEDLFDKVIGQEKYSLKENVAKVRK